jgi:hypothetical protein
MRQNAGENDNTHHFPFVGGVIELDQCLIQRPRAILPERAATRPLTDK